LSEGAAGLHDVVNADAVGFSVAARQVGRALAGDGIGFVATAMSHWHAVGVDAWLHHLRSSGEERPGVALLMPHARDGLLIGPDDLPLCQTDPGVTIIPVGAVFDGRGLRKWLDMLASVFGLLRLWMMRPGREARGSGPTLLLGSARNAGAAIFALARAGTRRVLRQRAIRLVAFDEGLGTYLEESIWEYPRRLERPRQGSGSDRGASLLRLLWGRARTAVAAGYPLEERFIFRRDATTGALAPNEAVVADYQVAMGAAHAGAPGLARGRRPIALVVPQPWSETQQVSREDELDLMRLMATRLVTAGFDVRIKPHPREAPGKYGVAATWSGDGCRAEDAAVAVERLFAGLRPGDVVVGFNSTCLLTASLLFGLPAYTVGGVLMARPGTGEWYRALQEGFTRLAGDSVGDFESRFGTV